ncbi:phage tail assembly chaperone [Consotaella aegiceratis]|uniref:phage tail assembly chaperone n=1 Tax=Consotaella aegiceratis TaxID=3097961 RepID=UPI003D80810F
MCPSDPGPGIPWRRAVFYDALGEGLRAYAERAFPLSIRDESGKSLRDRLEKRTEKAEKKGQADRAAVYANALETPPFPDPLAFVWSAYSRIRARKASGINGLDPIGWPDIDAFARLTRTWLPPWAVGLIEDLDGIFLDAPDGVKAIMAEIDKAATREAPRAVGKSVRRRQDDR